MNNKPVVISAALTGGGRAPAKGDVSARPITPEQIAMSMIDE